LRRLREIVRGIKRSYYSYYLSFERESTSGDIES
jgi:hypothetical protein